ncbi:peptidyl-prolyl cis-trans isomerase B [[Candida] railenensis]|uniref:Peptidyl-prolyl cis-trans isomerase n=1 Tax=[Candida] railenensis TaxID=45579 RepID=A0A9P0W083_9ASCO|nr:peptidyl-prolyl cis-trans isomerase B [[Candida] railenensis]
MKNILLYLSYLMIGALAASVSLLSAEELQHLDKDPAITHKVSFEMVQKMSDTEKVPLGTLHIALFGTVVPKTVRNFVELSKGTYGFGYEGSIFHRVIPHFVIQGGDFQYASGTGGYSIYNDFGRFDDENFDLHHNKLGRLSMANAGVNTNGAQFFITHSQELSNLDGKHVVFGQLVGGFDVLDVIATTIEEKDRPLYPVVINKVTVAIIDKVAGGEYDPALFEEQTYFYRYMMFFLLATLLAVVGRKYYFKRQLIRDKKEASFYN